MANENDTKAAAWLTLSAAALAYAEDKSKGQELANAAEEWGKAKRAAKQPAGDGPSIPFGRSKGTPVSQATNNDLEWVAGALRKSIADPEKERWRDSNETLLLAIESELDRRRE